jgi:hypothetical protein
VAKVSSVRVAPTPEDKPRELTPKEQEQMAFKYGNRKTRRKIAKRNKFFRDKSGTAWRESNRMIRNDETEVKL